MIAHPHVTFFYQIYAHKTTPWNLRRRICRKNSLFTETTNLYSMKITELPAATFKTSAPSHSPFASVLLRLLSLFIVANSQLITSRDTILATEKELIKHKAHFYVRISNFASSHYF